MSNIINGLEISKLIKEEVRLEVSKLDKKPCLAVIIVGTDPASQIYVKNKGSACSYTGIESITYSLDESTDTFELIDLIYKLNRDSAINGILVQLPLPAHIDEKKVLEKIDYKKDVDGFHPYNIGLLSTNNAILKPCTPAGCIELLDRYDINIEGKNCLIIGRSNIVGKPLSMLLLNRNATVTIAHSKTQNLKEISRLADIIFIAVGNPNFLKKDMIKEGVVLVDIGINRLADGSLCGDIEYDCREKTSYITPVPKGVGPMTIAMLMRNCLTAYKLQNNK